MVFGLTCWAVQGGLGFPPFDIFSFLLLLEEGFCSPLCQLPTGMEQ